MQAMHNMHASRTADTLCWILDTGCVVRAGAGASRAELKEESSHFAFRSSCVHAEFTEWFSGRQPLRLGLNLNLKVDNGAEPLSKSSGKMPWRSFFWICI